MHQIVFEVCAETLDACVAAQAGGAHRVELCSALSEGGSPQAMALYGKRLSIAACRFTPWSGRAEETFVYSPEETEVMSADILHMKSLGVAGIVLGVLRQDRSIDVVQTSRLVQMAHPMQVTFHRAFDSTPSCRRPWSMSLRPAATVYSHREAIGT